MWRVNVKAGGTRRGCENCNAERNPSTNAAPNIAKNGRNHVETLRRSLIMNDTVSSSPPKKPDIKTTRLKVAFNKVGEGLPPMETIQHIVNHVDKGPTSLAPFLGLLTIRGKPYSLRNHFVMEPLFKLQLPSEMVYKCGRQLSKSTSMSAAGILRCAAANDGLQQLFVTPLYEQIRRLSSNYVRPLINNSYIKDLLVDESCVQAVLQRSFANQSSMYFSFAFLDADRIRGLSVDLVTIDEVQDMDIEFIPVIQECKTASPNLGLMTYSGTPKTLDNTIEVLWQRSSQAEWTIPCYSCGYWNMCSIQADLLKMIGLQTIVCAKCNKPVNPRRGSWYHTEGKDRPDFHGYHVPQIIMPMHYDNPVKWRQILAKRDGRAGYTSSKFMNEVLGESADTGVRLITLTDIRNASTLEVNDWKKAVERGRRYVYRMLGVDWGGGGMDEISFTTVAYVGMTVDGKIECPFAMRFHSSSSHMEEARELMRLFVEGNCHYFCHDYGGSGAVRETLMIQLGMPIDRIIPFSYMRKTSGHIVTYSRPPEGDVRGHYILDKARSLVLQATIMKSGGIALPEFESSKDVTQDLLALMEDKHETPSGADIYLIRRRPGFSDDFAHSLNFGTVGIWHVTQNWPDLSLVENIKMSQEEMNFVSPPRPFMED